MAMALSDEQIDEQLLNSDLISSVAVEDQENLSGMTTEEKKNLLKEINQSKEDFSVESPSKMMQKLENSGFPSLPTPGRSTSRNKLKLPRRSNIGIKTDTENVSVKTISLIDDDNDDVQQRENKFMLPLFVNDDAPPLKIPERNVFDSINPYYAREGEHLEASLKRMLGHHLAWKNCYNNEMKRLQRNKLGLDKHLEDTDDVEQESSQVDDIYDFKSNSPLQVTKVYTGTKKKEPIQRTDSDSQGSYKGQQRRSSRDSDCQEVESAMKPDDPKLGDFIPVRQKSKRNRKQLFNPGQTMDERPEVSFDFDNSWDAQSGAWKTSQVPLNNQTPRTRRFLPKTPVIEEEKVQCPICQRDFGKSKVEAHAATCEGYSGLPMDVEESN